MNKENAIRDFLENVEQLQRLPLVTDSEMDELFGEDVAAALADLNRYNQEEQVCLHCQSRCCPAISCELYAPQFSQCPVYDFRPAVCRLHFCHRFHFTGSTLIEELGDILFDSLFTADRYGSTRVRLFDCPPLTGSAPGLIAVTSPWVNAVREDRLSPEYAGELIRREVEKHRTPPTHGEMPTEDFPLSPGEYTMRVMEDLTTAIEQTK